MVLVSDRTPQESRQQIVGLAKGDKGERGEQGRQGEQGKRGQSLNRATRRALGFLLTVSLLIGAINLYWTSYVVRGNNQEKCATVQQLAHIPIPRPIAGNPSREFAAATERVYRARARELGCAGSAP